jgi:glycine cleavage system pyridoxal-binding protein P
MKCVYTQYHLMYKEFGIERAGNCYLHIPKSVYDQVSLTVVQKQRTQREREVMRNMTDILYRNKKIKLTY